MGRAKASDIVSSYSDGCTLEEVAKEFGVSTGNVKRALAEAGVAVRGRGFAGFRPERRSEVSRMGGASVAPERRAYAQNRELASVAGSIGGMSKHHGLAVPGRRISKTQEHHIWRGMLARCLNAKTKHYASYGGRGVKVCDRWMNFDNFLNDMGARPSLAHSVDRINNDGNYEPGNCRWATRSEQQNNTRATRFVEAFGERRCVSDWQTVYGVPRRVILGRLSLGWMPEDAVSVPARSRSPRRPYLQCGAAQ